MKTLRVATLNIWNRFGPWDQRLAAIRAGVRSLAPDLLGLQEVAAARRRATATGSTRPPPSPRAAATTSPTRARTTSAGSATPRSRAGPSREAPRLRAAARAARTSGATLLYADVDSPFGRIPFFVTHLNWKFDEGHVREAQVREIVRRIAALRAAGAASPPSSSATSTPSPRPTRSASCAASPPSAAPKRVYFQDAFALAGDGSPGFTFSRRNPFAAPLGEPDRRIDYVFVRGRDERHRGEPARGARLLRRARRRDLPERSLRRRRNLRDSEPPIAPGGGCQSGSLARRSIPRSGITAPPGLRRRRVVVDRESPVATMRRASGGIYAEFQRSCRTAAPP